MTRVYYSINWTTRTTAGVFRRYNRILEGEDMNDHKAQEFARNKANNSRNFCVDCWRMDNEIIEPEYKDIKGKTKVHTLQSEMDDFYRCCFVAGLNVRAGEIENHGNLGMFQIFYLD